MSDVTNLRQQLDAELTGAVRRAQQEKQEFAQVNQERQERLKQFDALLARLQRVWMPRFQLLQERFAKLMQVQPEVKPHARGVTFSFASTYRVQLQLSAYPDRDVRNLVLEYDLLILPMLMKYDRNARLEASLDRVDAEAIGRWLDERLLGFVKTYVALQGNNFLLENLSAE